MKNIRILILSFVFALASLGMSGTLHYCAGKIKEVSMEGKHSGCGSCSTASSDKSCCTEEATIFQYDDFQFQKTSFSIQYLPSFVVTIPYYIPLDENQHGSSESTKGFDHLSFLYGSTDVQSRLCVFLI